MKLNLQIVFDFGDNPNFKCDPNAFVNNWPKYGLKVRDLVAENIGPDWDQEVENLLLLLHVFPTKSCHLPLSDAIKKFIVFRVVSFAICFCLWFFYNNSNIF